MLHNVHGSSAECRLNMKARRESINNNKYCTLKTNVASSCSGSFLVRIKFLKNECIEIYNIFYCFLLSFLVLISRKARNIPTFKPLRV